MRIESIPNLTGGPPPASPSGYRPPAGSERSSEAEAPPSPSLPGHKAGAANSEPAVFPAKGDEVEQAVASLENAAKEHDIALKFSRDEDTGTIVIQLIDQKSGEQVQQIPSEVALRVAAELGKLQGNIFSQKA